MMGTTSFMYMYTDYIDFSFLSFLNGVIRSQNVWNTALYVPNYEWLVQKIALIGVYFLSFSFFQRLKCENVQVSASI